MIIIFLNVEAKNNAMEKRDEEEEEDDDETSMSESILVWAGSVRDQWKVCVFDSD